MAAIEDSKAYLYVLKKAWAHRPTEDHIILETCPICLKDNWHFYIRYSPAEKDGLWDCKVCGENGNLYQLAEFNGDKLGNVTSIKDYAEGQRAPQAMPDANACHRRMMTEAETAESEEAYTALDYLMDRGYTMDVIERYKLGLINEYGKRWLTIPYFQKDNLVFVKFRTLPPDPKEFRGLSGREAPLFNSDCLTRGMEQLLFVEGEGDALSCLSNGIDYVVGVPGANLKKLSWLQKVDEVGPKKIFVLYDRDKTGQTAAKEMAQRIGIDKVRNILLPEFTFKDEKGEEKEGKDINEWFRAGHTAEEFEQLKAEAKMFTIDGVSNVGTVIEEIRSELLERGSLQPRWVSKWPSLNAKMGGYEPGDLVGVMAEGKVGKTTMMQDELDHLNKTYDEPVFMFCQEMRPNRLVRKWMSNVTDTAEKDFTLETVDTSVNIAASRKADYLFGYTGKSAKRADVYETIRQVVRRYGVKFVCFDNLQILCRNIEHAQTETSVITKEFKELAMELGIVIFLVIQPHRVREGEIIGARNAHGSSAIEKDVDTMICLHRERVGKIKGEDFAAMGFMETDVTFAPEMMVIVDLSRYAAGGTTTLKMIGDKSRVEEMSYVDRAEKQKLVPMNEQLEAA